MSASVVALVLSNTEEAVLRSIPAGAPVWIASTPETRKTLEAAKRLGLSIIELIPNGSSPDQWLINHLDSVDQHHNEVSQAQPYTTLLVYGVAHSESLVPLLRGFGFASSSSEPFGFSATKLAPFEAHSVLV